MADSDRGDDPGRDRQQERDHDVREILFPRRLDRAPEPPPRREHAGIRLNHEQHDEHGCEPRHQRIQDADEEHHWDPDEKHRKASTNLYVENHLSEPATATVRVYDLSEGVFGGGSSDLVFSDALGVPGRRSITGESVYDVQGTYRTEAEHAGRLESTRSEVDSCDDRVVTVGIGEPFRTVLTGRPDELLLEATTHSANSG